ncbi:MAG: Uma2 family endonuclease [Cyanobacteriota bacterium]|nr:Uma2 family endonuclease [Cyanobacteriota bacterium]
MIESTLPSALPDAIAEKRVTFHHLTWQAYQQILQALGENRTARLTYDCGILEITMPLEDHEFAIRLIERLIYFLVVELGLKIKTMGSTTLQREDLDRSPEPDNAYYIQNQYRVAGRKVNLQQDPPPDLVVEVDMTHTDINKLQLYASLGVPEFWRYNGKVWRIYKLQDGKYEEVQSSPTFPLVTKEWFYRFLQQARTDEVEAERSFRAWIQQQIKNER